MVQVGIIMGSNSDWNVIKGCGFEPTKSRLLCNCKSKYSA